MEKNIPDHGKPSSSVEEIVDTVKKFLVLAEALQAKGIISMDQYHQMTEIKLKFLEDVENYIVDRVKNNS